MRLLGSLALGIFLIIGAGSDAAPLKKYQFFGNQNLSVLKDGERPPMLEPVRMARLIYKINKTIYTTNEDGSVQGRTEETPCHGELTAPVYDARGLNGFGITVDGFHCMAEIYGKSVPIFFNAAMFFADFDGTPRTYFWGNLSYNETESNGSSKPIYNGGTFSSLGYELTNGRFEIFPGAVSSSTPGVVEFFSGTLEIIDDQRP